MVGVFFLAPIGLAQPVSAELLPHRVAYELFLLDAEPDFRIENASGLFVFQVTGSSCAGWTTESSVAVTLISQTGVPLTTETDYKAFESADGDIFTYETNTQISGENPVLESGAAQRDGAGALTIQRMGDEAGSSTAAIGTLFPIQLTQAILDAAEARETMFFSRMFDGSHPSGQAESVTAIIGERTEPSLVSPIVLDGRERFDDQLLQQGQVPWDDFDPPYAAWPVLLSYFDPTEPDSSPSIQVSYTLDSNGVSDDVVLDYGSFSLRGVLLDFAPFRPLPCSN